MSKNSGNALLAILAGMLVGAGIGVLFAPDKGEKTRQKIKDEFDKSKEDLLKKYQDLIQSLQDKKESVMSDLKDIVEEFTSKENHETEDLIKVLEEKLELLKKRTSKS